MVTSKISMLVIAFALCAFLTGCQSGRHCAAGAPGYEEETQQSALAGTAADDYAKVLADPGRF